MHGHGCISRVNHDLAQVVRVAGVVEQAIFYQPFFVLQCVEFLCVVDVVQEDTKNVKDQYQPNDG